jgi:hypothetical protein
MEWWLVVLLVVVAAVIVAIGIALIALLLQLRKAVAAVSLGVEEGLRLIGELRRLLLPALEVWTATGQRLEKTLRDAEPAIASAGRFVTTMERIAQRIESVEERVYRRLARPLEETTAVLAAVLKAISTFVRFLTNRRAAASAD